MPTEAEVLKALSAIQDPDLGQDLVSLGFIKDLAIGGGAVSFTIELTTPACPVREQFKAEAERLVGALPGVATVRVAITSKVQHGTGAARKIDLPCVSHIVIVASGKGGVGKSTTSANLAVALAKTGARVGLVDLDVYGPSIPTLMGIKDQPRVENDRIIPIMAHGVKVVSMGFFIPPGEAVIWRGPLLHSAVEQFMAQVDWGELDYLIADFPPGTGDVQLSMGQLITATGAVIVSTPQDLALEVARRAVTMFERLNTPLLGVIENMSYFICPSCGAREEIFGSGGAKRAAEWWHVPVLAEIPLSGAVRETGDAGTPIVAAQPDSPQAKAYLDAARALAARISVVTAKA
jgi:ATP-binding protein involved in chromosome partitioning